MELRQGDLPAEIADTTLSLDDGAKPCEVDCDSPPVIVCGRIFRHLTESQCDRMISQDLASEGVDQGAHARWTNPLLSGQGAKLSYNFHPRQGRKMTSWTRQIQK